LRNLILGPSSSLQSLNRCSKTSHGKLNLLMNLCTDDISTPWWSWLKTLCQNKVCENHYSIAHCVKFMISFIQFSNVVWPTLCQFSWTAIGISAHMWSLFLLLGIVSREVRNSQHHISSGVCVCLETPNGICVCCSEGLIEVLGIMKNARIAT